MKNIKRTYLLLLIVISLVGVATYSTYALFTSSLEIGDITLDTELKYTFKINSNQEFTIGANSKLRFNAIVENDMEGTISYGVYYKMVSPININDNITIAEVADTNTLTTSGPIESGSDNNITVPLVIINNSSEEIKVQIGVRTGYYTESMQPEDIIYETGETLITDIIDSETAGNGYQCDASVGSDCSQECFDIKEGQYLNTYCDTTCTSLSESKFLTNLDISGANEPELTDNLVPVMYNGTTWVTADRTNGSLIYQWYDYDAKMWANAVLLTATKRNSLTKDSNGNYTPGQTIGDTESEGVLAFYVWIPRYKYRVWNINKEIGTDTYDAYNTGIDIIFEKGVETTGTITCSYSFAAPVSTKGSPNEKCSGTDSYYTHPAFKFGNDNVTGFWMGKFELSSSSPTASYGGGNSETLTPRIVPNVMAWSNNYPDNYWRVIYNMQSNGNVYGLSTSRTIVDTHMLTNMEWGAVTYLAYSKYGRCIENENIICTDVYNNNSNNSYNSYTGRSSGGFKLASNTYGTYTYDGKSVSSSGTIGSFVSDRTLGTGASTTGNIYGVYDMSGGAYDAVMGFMSSASGSFNYNGGSNYTYAGYEKYLVPYAYGTDDYNQIAYNRGKLGDATSEVVLTAGQTYGGWHNNGTDFLNKNGNYYYSLFIRGGYGGYNSGSGMFGFFSTRASYNSAAYISARAGLIVFP